MTKKDYELIAGVVKRELPLFRKTLTRAEYLKLDEFNRAQADTAWRIAIRFEEVLKEENPKFNGGKFLRACGFFRSG
jgi:hypothetical protein